MSTDAVGSIAFHPFESCLLSASGSRHFIDEEIEESEDDLSDLGADGGRGSDSHSCSKKSPSGEAASFCYVGFHAEVVELVVALSKRQF